MTHREIIIFLVSIGLMLVFSRLIAEIGKIFRLPIVMGELIAGIILGPAMLGYLFPEFFIIFFPGNGNVFFAMDGIIQLSVIMLLFVAGLEVQLPMILNQGKLAVYISAFGMIIPFIVGFSLAWYFPGLFNLTSGTNNIIFSLFLGTALSISALPVIARILMDINLLKSKIGHLILASAMFNDLVGWLIFAIIIGLMRNNINYYNILITILIVIAFGIIVITLGKKLIDKTLPWVHNNLSWPGGVLALSMGLCFFLAAFSQWIGIHAIFGAFLAGIAIGDSAHFNEKEREILHQFVTNIFAPLFFVSIGLRVNFIENFNFSIVFIILLIAFIGKISGAGIGAMLGGLKRNQAMAIGFGLNARGAMEIILGTLALNAGIINKTLYVALIIMALITSFTSGPMIKYFLNKR